MGLLWPGRNSKTFTLVAAYALVHTMRFPPLYALDIYKKYSP
jgi:hypothetical protein